MAEAVITFCFLSRSLTMNVCRIDGDGDAGRST